MKNYFGILALAIIVSLFSCNKENTDALSNSSEISTKSVQIAANESVAENAVADSNYEADFYLNAEKALTKRYGLGNKWKWMPQHAL